MNKFKNLSEFVFYPEVIIYSEELGIAGSIDVLAKDTKNDTYIIIDWKTSKSISKSSFGGRMGIHPITSHLMDCKYVHYSMQLSLYRYLIEEFYGIKVSNLLIAHLKDNECKPIVADYYHKEVLDMVNEHRKTQNSLN
jgi:ATP-dependent exoDNAse (exonuclease V) beta subunit